MNYSLNLKDKTTQRQLDSSNQDEADVESVNSSPEQNKFAKNVLQHKFVIGIAKPEEMRVGLNTIKKSKVTIKGKLGITRTLI